MSMFVSKLVLNNKSLCHYSSPQKNIKLYMSIISWHKIKFPTSPTITLNIKYEFNLIFIIISTNIYKIITFKYSWCRNGIV